MNILRITLVDSSLLLGNPKVNLSLTFFVFYANELLGLDVLLISGF